MHHAPQNIQSGSRPSNVLVEANAAAAPSGGQRGSRPDGVDIVDAGHAAPADLRTRIIAYSGPSVVRGSGTQPRVAGNDPVPPQTFWCEMHQGADALAAEDSQLSASLALLSKDALIARVVAAEGKVAKYRHKVQQIQDALADHS